MNLLPDTEEISTMHPSQQQIRDSRQHLSDTTRKLTGDQENCARDMDSLKSSVWPAWGPSSEQTDLFPFNKSKNWLAFSGLGYWGNIKRKTLHSYLGVSDSEKKKKVWFPFTMTTFNQGNLDLGIFGGKGSMAAFTADGESLQVCCIRVAWV